MNSAHIVATGGVTAMLAGVLVWATHWPLQPIDSDTALNLAGLIVALGGGILALLRAWLARRAAQSPEAVSPTAKTSDAA